MTATAVDTLAAVRAHGGDVLLGSPGRLRVVAPAPLPNELIERLRAAKPYLLTLLAHPKPIIRPDDTWTDREEERAAIVEYDGGVPRDWAEGFAQLDPNKPPRQVTLERWWRFIDDCGRFLDAGWAARAAALGWGPLHLFGCNRKRPFARLDHRGLLWEINGGRLIVLYRDGAIIETLRGDRLRYRRQPLNVGQVVLAWKLS
jgi:hypothetical protein